MRARCAQVSAWEGLNCPLKAGIIHAVVLVKPPQQSSILSFSYGPAGAVSWHFVCSLIRWAVGREVGTEKASYTSDLSSVLSICHLYLSSDRNSEKRVPDGVVWNDMPGGNRNYVELMSLVRVFSI